MRSGQNFISASLALLLLVIGGCGGSSGSDGVLAGGGIGGTGSGTVTGFGSVIINDTREFELGGNTQVRIDGDDSSEDDLAIGMVVRFEVEDDVNDDFTAGTASIIEAVHQVKGPVTSLSPLSVLGQTIITTASTVLEGFNSTASLALGDELEVSGHADAGGIVRATRLELKTQGLVVWKLVGTVAGVNTDGFNISSQFVALNGIQPRDCGGGLANGDLVEIKATPDDGFSAGESLTTVTDVECISAALSVSGNPVASAIAGEIEGFVTQVLPGGGFVVNGQSVIINASTLFEGGSVDDLVVGVKLEAEGRFDTSSSVLAAVRIRFRETRVRIEAPLASADIDVGESLDILGIHVIANAQTEDEDGIVSAGNGDRQVEIRGYVDGDGNVIAEEVRERGDIDFEDVRLRGPVSEINAPAQRLVILGVLVDVSTAGTLYDGPGVAVDINAFFGALSVGEVVQVDGEYVAASSLLLADEVELED